ncbi:hypothetical protein [Streptomyces tubercidicus]
MNRSLAVAVTSVAVAAIAFAGVTPASAASWSRAKCIAVDKSIGQHKMAGHRYEELAKKEVRKAHPDMNKVRQYDAKASEEFTTAQALELEFQKQCRR